MVRKSESREDLLNLYIITPNKDPLSCLALIAPTPLESKLLRCEMHPHPDESMKSFQAGKLHGKNVIFTHCGVGKVNAAHSTILLLEKYKIDALVLFGIGGGYCGSVGDVVVAETENYGEEGVLTSDGWKSMEITGFPFVKKEKEYYNIFPMDRQLFELAIKASSGFNVRSGNFVTVSQCSGTRETGEIMKNRFNGICENMEGAAVAHICTLYDVPMIEIRGISNVVGNQDKWRIEEAAANCNKSVIELIKKI